MPSRDKALLQAAMAHVHGLEDWIGTIEMEHWMTFAHEGAIVVELVSS